MESSERPKEGGGGATRSLPRDGGAEEFHGDQTVGPRTQWRSKGGKWGHAPWSAGLGAQQHTLCSHFRHVFKLKFRPKYA